MDHLHNNNNEMKIFICLSLLFVLAQCGPVQKPRDEKAIGVIGGVPYVAHSGVYAAHPVAHVAHVPVVHTVTHHVVTKPVTYTHTVHSGVLTHTVHGGYVVGDFVDAPAKAEE